MAPLESAAIVAAGWAVAGLAWSVARAWRRPVPVAAAAPAGEAWRGILYAFGPGMSPRAKESALGHPIVYAAGVAYHLAVFSAIATFALIVMQVRATGALAGAFAALQAIGVLAGLTLAARRATTPLLLEISAFDDFASNILVDIWLLLAAISWLIPNVRAAFLIASIVLAIYAPLGKIRHCAFFFVSRGLFGARLGRRGIVGARRAEASQ